MTQILNDPNQPDEQATVGKSLVEILTLCSVAAKQKLPLASESQTLESTKRDVPASSAKTESTSAASRAKSAGTSHHYSANYTGGSSNNHDGALSGSGT
jgi:hypothetical protein